LQNFSILRATRAFSPATICSVNRKELSAVMVECAARSERAAVMQQEATARQEKATAKLEEAVALREATTARLEKHWDEASARWEREQVAMRESRERQDKLHQAHVNRIEAMMAENKEWTKRIFAELDDQRDERRALIEALLQAIDRLPPPPPHLRSA
jgi:hypothetical protein